MPDIRLNIYRLFLSEYPTAQLEWDVPKGKGFVYLAAHFIPIIQEMLNICMMLLKVFQE